MTETSGNYNTQNLIPRTAPDAPGRLTEDNSLSVSVRLEKDDVAWLGSLPGDRSYHIRQAVKKYREEFDENT